MSRALLLKRVLLAILLGSSFLAPSLAFAQTTPTFTRPLSLGAKGSDVSALQQILKDKSYFTYPTVTDYFGTFTQTAVKAFQKDNNLEQVGSVGPLTRSLLNAYLSNTSGSTGASIPPSSTASSTSTTTAPTTPPTFNTTPLPGYAPGQIIFGGGPAPDTVAPTISTVSTTATRSSITITWTTNEPATSQLFYGTNTSYASSTAADSALVTNHSVVITGLISYTSYHFQIKSSDAAGNTALSSDQLATTSLDYYVDNVSGNDTNDGRSAATAFKTFATTIAAVGSQTYQKIGLARGSTWKEELIFSNNPGTQIIAYGTGAMPFIDGSDTIVPGSFSLLPGTTTVYQAAVTFSGTAGTSGTNQRLIWENNANLVQVTSTTTVGNTPGSFFYDSYSSSSGTVYIHATDNSNPSSSGKTYDYTNRYNALSITGDYCRVDGIRTRRQRDNNGSIEIFGDHCTIANGIAEDGHKHVALMREDAIVQNYIFRNAYNGTIGSPNLLVFNKNVGASMGAQISNSQFYNDPAVTFNNSTSAIIAHVNASGDFGVLTSSSNTFTNESVVFATSAFTSIQSSSDTVINTTQIGSLQNGMTASFTNLAHSITQGVGGAADYVSSTGGSGRLAVTFTSSTFSPGTYPMRIQGNNVDTTFQSCTITPGSTTGFPVGTIRPTGTGNTLTVYDTTLGQAGVLYNLAADTVYVGDRNTFIKTGSNWIFQRTNSNVVNTNPAGTAKTAWTTYSGQDANSIFN